MRNLQVPSNRSELVRVGRGYPCPICGKPDWCSVSSDGNICICMRVSEGSQQQTQNGGYLHRLTPESPGLTDTDKTPAPGIPGIPGTLGSWCNFHAQCGQSQGRPSHEWQSLAQLYHLKAEQIGLQKLGDELGVSAASLRSLEAGWCNKYQAWSFPMKQGGQAYCGIRLRSEQGSKWAIKGSKQGLFIPTTLPAKPQTLLIAEGPSDTAAVLDMSHIAIGRPSCSGGVAQLLAYMQLHRPSQLVIASDYDEPGQRGAAVLANKLASQGLPALVITPPAGCKDMRAWRQAGATANDLARLISAKPSKRVSVAVGGAV